MCKILSSIVTSRTSHHINANKILPNEQKGNTINTYGTIDQLFIDKMVMDNVKLKQRNISTAGVDYKKVFESVPRDWIIETLKIHKFDPITTKSLRKTINKWKASLHRNHWDGQIKTDHFSINTSIFQGDSPSSLLFDRIGYSIRYSIGFDRIGYRYFLSLRLNASNIGYRINRQGDIIWHL